MSNEAVAGWVTDCRLSLWWFCSRSVERAKQGGRQREKRFAASASTPVIFFKAKQRSAHGKPSSSISQGAFGFLQQQPAAASSITGYKKTAAGLVNQGRAGRAPAGGGQDQVSGRVSDPVGNTLLHFLAQFSSGFLPLFYHT